MNNPRPKPCKNHEWKKLTTISDKERQTMLHTNNHRLTTGTVQPSYYLDVNGKEWIILLLPEPFLSTEHWLYRNMPSLEHDSYLYDVENDKLVPLIEDYQTDINERFNVYQSQTRRSAIYKSHVIDNDNHVMYWLVTHNADIGRHDPADRASAALYSIIIAFDIRNLKDIKVLYTQKISQKEFPSFSENGYTMVIVGNTIQFVLGGYIKSYVQRNGAWRHYEFDLIKRELKLIHDNIHSKYIDHITYNKVLKLFENLKIGDFIDARTSSGDFFLAQIMDIKDKKFVNVDDININSKKLKNEKLQEKKIESMKIKVHYVGLFDRFDEWIDITTTACDMNISETSLCDCIEQCYFSQNGVFIYRSRKLQKLHRIALPKSQSLRFTSMKDFNAVYSKCHEKLIILGANNESNNGPRARWSGLYYKHINGDLNYTDYKCQLIVNGFINQIDKNINNLFINIPKDINRMIFNYYFWPNDDEWTRAIKKDKNGAFIQDKYKDYFCLHSGCLIVNNGNHIFIFGGTKNRNKTGDIFKFNVGSHVLERLTDIKTSLANWNAVLCQKSQVVHLFERDMSSHVSISLRILNNASTVVVET